MTPMGMVHRVTKGVMAPPQNRYLHCFIAGKSRKHFSILMIA